MTRTRGNVIVEEIQLGDVHYEYEYNMCIKSTVTKLPELNEDGNWEWQSTTDKGRVIDYLINPQYTHYSSKLYNHEAYLGCTIID